VEATKTSGIKASLSQNEGEFNFNIYSFMDIIIFK